MTNNTLYVLGAEDPEMVAIESRLRGAGLPVVYARKGGKRVIPGTAYKADAVSASLDGLTSDDTVVLVECDLPGCFSGDPSPWIVSIDHHRPGDIGYGRPPEEYAQASSLGQLLCLLGREPTPEERLVMAADHCLAAAYQGRCPGVNPQALMKFRAEGRAAFQKRPVEEVVADVVRATEALKNADNYFVGKEETELLSIFHSCKDMRGAHVPELPEAASRLGIGYIAQTSDRDGRVKEVLGGLIAPEAIRMWMAARKAEGREVYGDPERGYAGAYLS